MKPGTWICRWPSYWKLITSTELGIWLSIFCWGACWLMFVCDTEPILRPLMLERSLNEPLAPAAAALVAFARIRNSLTFMLELVDDITRLLLLLTWVVVVVVSVVWWCCVSVVIVWIWELGVWLGASGGLDINLATRLSVVVGADKFFWIIWGESGGGDELGTGGICCASSGGRGGHGGGCG